MILEVILLIFFSNSLLLLRIGGGVARNEEGARLGRVRS